jgi:hypothetical protein
MEAVPWADEVDSAATVNPTIAVVMIAMTFKLRQNGLRRFQVTRQLNTRTSMPSFLW